MNYKLRITYNQYSPSPSGSLPTGEGGGRGRSLFYSYCFFGKCQVYFLKVVDAVYNIL